jgi:hypothetical protein
MGLPEAFHSFNRSNLEAIAPVVEHRQKGWPVMMFSVQPRTIQEAFSLPEQP